MLDKEEQRKANQNMGVWPPISRSPAKNAKAKELAGMPEK